MQDSAYLPLFINPQAPITINAQIIGQILLLITAGKLEIGVSLPSVTQLAQQLEINPNTIATVYRNLAGAGYVVSQRGRGTFIANSREVAKLRENVQLSKAIDQAYSLASTIGLSPNIFSALAYAGALAAQQQGQLLKLVFVGFSQVDQQIYQQVKAQIDTPLKFILGADLEVDLSNKLQQLVDADLIITSQKLWEIISVVKSQQEVVKIDAKLSPSLLETIGTLPYETKVLLIGQDESESEEIKRIFNNSGVHHLNFGSIELATLENNPELLLQADKVCMLPDVETKVQRLSSTQLPTLPFEFILDSNHLFILRARITAVQTAKKIAQETS